MVRFIQGGPLCRCGEPDVKCGVHMTPPRPKPKKRGK